MREGGGGQDVGDGGEELGEVKGEKKRVEDAMEEDEKSGLVVEKKRISDVK